jgi:hypothetical protein
MLRLPQLRAGNLWLLIETFSKEEIVQIGAYEVPASALRVFTGYRKPDLPADRFRQLLASAFMPGTPYMLQPLGLAAYLPAVTAKDDKTQPTVPDEFAIIAYPSQEKWRQIMNDTLRGRVYNQTHGGVYDAKSHASFPVSLDRLPVQATDPYYLFEVATDWQAGRTAVFIATGPSARAAARSAVLQARPTLNNAGIDQCVVTAGDDWVILWLHSLSGDPTPLLTTSFVPGLTPLAAMQARRIVCVGEPPNVQLQSNDALNFIFVRATEHFLQ